MADDIVTRLRHMHMEMPFDDYEDLISEAVAEIERLRSAGKTLARAVATYCGDDAWADRALKAWEEARRG